MGRPSRGRNRFGKRLNPGGRVPRLGVPVSVVAGAAGFFLQIDEPVAVGVGEEEHRRGAVEVDDLIVVQFRARLAKPRVGGLGAGRAQPYGHRYLAVGRQQHQADAGPGGHHFHQPGPGPHLDVSAQLAAEYFGVERQCPILIGHRDRHALDSGRHRHAR